MEPLLEGNVDVEEIWLNMLSLWEFKGNFRVHYKSPCED